MPMPFSPSEVVDTGADESLRQLRDKNQSTDMACMT